MFQVLWFDDILVILENPPIAYHNPLPFATKFRLFGYKCGSIQVA